jgi:hypothetical protein
MRTRLTGLFVAILFAAAASAQGYQAQEVYKFSNGAQAQNASALKNFSHSGEVQGSQFLFRNWVKGVIVNNEGVEFTNGSFNYDKISQNLYINTNENNQAFLIFKKDVKSFTLSEGDSTVTLEKVPALNNDQFYSVLAKGPRYSLYALTKTKFIPASFSTNGISSSGNTYDEYRDEKSYFIVSASGAAHPVSMKKKSVKAALEADKDKVETYFKQNAEATLDEAFVSMLVQSLNL